jgi:hypothetical protein
MLYASGAKKDVKFVGLMFALKTSECQVFYPIRHPVPVVGASAISTKVVNRAGDETRYFGVIQTTKPPFFGAYPHECKVGISVTLFPGKVTSPARGTRIQAFRRV